MNKFDFAQISEVRLSSGSHSSPNQGMCFMEMTAWFAGEKHSDRPACACPILGSYGITLNDNMPDDLRDRLLKPLVPLIAGTRGTPQEELTRARFLAMWSVNRLMPIYLRAYGVRALDELADACEAAKSVDELRQLAARADLAALADRAALARNQILELMAEGLRQAILIGPHEGFDAAIDLVQRHQALRELVDA